MSVNHERKKIAVRLESVMLKALEPWAKALHATGGKVPLLRMDEAKAKAALARTVQGVLIRGQVDALPNSQLRRDVRRTLSYLQRAATGRRASEERDAAREILRDLLNPKSWAASTRRKGGRPKTSESQEIDRVIWSLMERTNEPTATIRDLAAEVLPRKAKVMGWRRYPQTEDAVWKRWQRIKVSRAK